MKNIIYKKKELSDMLFFSWNYSQKIPTNVKIIATTNKIGSCANFDMGAEVNHHPNMRMVNVPEKIAIRVPERNFFAILNVTITAVNINSSMTTLYLNSRLEGSMGTSTIKQKIIHAIPIDAIFSIFLPSPITTYSFSFEHAGASLRPYDRRMAIP